MTEQISLEAAIEAVLRDGPTFETIAGLCKMAVEASQKQADKPIAWMDADDNLFYTEEDAFKTGVKPIRPLLNGPEQIAPNYNATSDPRLMEMPVQEPVAWKHTMLEDVVIGHRPADLNVHPDRWMPLYKDPTPCKTCEALARTVMMDQTAHDTPPTAQRQWVGLTDEERNKLWRDVVGWGDPSHDDEDLMKALEAKLRELNGGAA
jgi:hypothetical protein